MIEKVKSFFNHEGDDNEELTLQRQFDNLYRTLHGLGQVTDELGEVVDLEDVLNRLELLQKGGEKMLDTIPETYGSYPLREIVEKLLRGEKDPAFQAAATGSYEVMPESDKYTAEEMKLFGDLFQYIDELPADQLVTSKGDSFTAEQLKNRIIKVSDGEADPSCLPRQLGEGNHNFVLRDVVIARVMKARGQE